MNRAHATDIVTMSEVPPGVSGGAQAQSSLPLRGTRLLRRSLVGLLAIMTVAFGAVHPTAFYLFTCGACVLAAIGFWRAMREGGQFGSSIHLVVGAHLWLLIAFVAQAPLGVGRAQGHPLVSSAHYAVAPDALISAIGMVVLSLAVLVLSYCLSRRGHETRSFFRQSIVAISGVVAFFALAHWLTDNGKLFWTFEPNNVVPSSRARWPFVNPNHLGHYLCICLPLVLTALGNTASRVAGRIDPAQITAQRSASALFADRELSGQLYRLGYLLVVAMLVGLALILSQSRSSWIAALTSVLIVWLATRRQSDSSDTVAATQVSRRRQRDRSNDRGLVNNILSKTLAAIHAFLSSGSVVVVLAIGLVAIMLLGDYGARLLETRIAYGLLYSFDDIRWTMLSESFPMFMSNWFFGVGIGAWNELYPTLMSERMAGLNPQFLHNDPLQLLIEVGVLGAAPLVIALVLIALRAVRIIAAASAADRLVLVGPFAATLALLVACCFDFSFRVPAIVGLWALCLGILLAKLDARSVEATRMK